MGADVHLVVGRIRQQLAITNQSTAVRTETDQQLSVIIGREITRADIELEQPTGDNDLNRCYNLFAWLADVRGYIKPYHDNLEVRRDRTLQFLKLLGFDSDGFHEKINNKWRDEDGCWIGDHSFNFYTIAELVAFDYDQPVVWQNYGGERYIDTSNPETYRTAFQYSNLFPFLEYAQREGWQFLIIGFDN